MKKAKKTHKRMMNGGVAATTKPAFNKGPAISTKPAFDKGSAISGRGGMKRMMDGGMAAMTRPAFDKGRAPMTKPAFDKGQAPMTKPAFNKGQAIMGGLPEAFGGAGSPGPRVSRPAVIGARPPGGKFILPQQPNTIGTGNGPDYQSGYSEGPRGGRGGYSGADRGQRPSMGSNIGANLRGALSGIGIPAEGASPSAAPMLSGVAGGLGAFGMKKGGVVKGKKMRGGGLARKGVGMALAKGGLAKRAGGCAKRGVGRGRIV